MKVIQFPGHKRAHGLGLCVTCGGAEASLPSHCPGTQMHEIISDSVQAGEMDFKNGKWIELEVRRIM